MAEQNKALALMALKLLAERDEEEDAKYVERRQAYKAPPNKSISDASLSRRGDPVGAKYADQEDILAEINMLRLKGGKYRRLPTRETLRERFRIPGEPSYVYDTEKYDSAIEELRWILIKDLSTELPQGK